MAAGKIVALRRVDGSAAEMSDEALVAACALGDRAALGALFDRYYDAVRVFVAHFVSADPADIEDLVQITFETVQRAAPRFKQQSKVKTWILGIAHNVSRRHIRSRLRHKSFAVELVRQPLEPSVPLDELLVDKQRMERLAAAIPELSPKLREVFVLVYVQGLSDTEAAEVLGARVGTVWKRLHDARNKIRQALGETR